MKIKGSMLELLRKDKHWVEYPFGAIFYGKLVSFLKHKKIHPSYYTLGFIVLGLFAGVFIGMGYVLVSFMCWRLSIILDLVDGPIARYQNKTSKLGEYLDNVGHVFCGLAITTGAVYGAFSSNKIFAGVIAALVFIMVYIVKYIHYSVFQERNKFRLIENRKLIFVEKRLSDFFDIEMLFLLKFLPLEGFFLFIATKLIRFFLIIYKSISYARKENK